MEFQQMSNRAGDIRNKYREFECIKYGKEWTAAQIMQGFIGDVGDLSKLVLAKEGVRDIQDVDEKLSHELSDCLWSILVLAKEYDIDIEKDFLSTMDVLDEKITKKLKS